MESSADIHFPRHLLLLDLFMRFSLDCIMEYILKVCDYLSDMAKCKLTWKQSCLSIYLAILAKFLSLRIYFANLARHEGMAWRSLCELNEEMVKNFKHMSLVSTNEVENAFLSIPRAAFLPEYLHDEAYADYPVRGDDHLHMSAPHMYATVLEALNLKEGLYFNK